MKSHDIFILLKLVSLDLQKQADGRHQSVRSLGEMTGIGKTEVSDSLNRSMDVGLAKRSAAGGVINVNRKALFEFIFYGLGYVFPVRAQALTRGIPTAFAAPLLKKKLFSPGDIIPVWPSADAEQMGQSVQPLYKSVPQAVAKDETRYAALALTDAIRLGKAREKHLAAEELQQLLELD